jgi:hypothetical protein
MAAAICSSTAVQANAMNGDWLPDEAPVRSLCGRMVCTRCSLSSGSTQARRLDTKHPKVRKSVKQRSCTVMPSLS